MEAQQVKLKTDPEDGRFLEDCVCGEGDFYCVHKRYGAWFEADAAVEQWEGWACYGCNRIYSNEGVLLAQPQRIERLDDI